ncbi:hypothetical protein BJY01DRAFT_252055 [Aspergillus pseudoustus]|uniref:Short-chain dehydrogenase n=1 Tax=Aspergillus pseudoustus TaxID=1810923 RepID=A0ABR4J8E8_9EURO
MESTPLVILSTASKLQDALAGASSEHQHDEYSLDLSSLANVRLVANTINMRVADGSLPPIRALVLNAGYQEHTEQYFSEDSLDMSVQCNYLSHWLLTLMLLQSMDKQRGRILVLGSSTHDPNHPANDSVGMFKDKQWKILLHDTHGLAKGTWSSARDDSSFKAGFRRYGAGKLCEIMMMRHAERTYASWIEGFGGRRDSRAAGSSSSITADESKWGNSDNVKVCGRCSSRIFDSKSLGEMPKALYLNGTDVTQPSPEARDMVKQGMLWRDSITYANLQQGETTLSDWD